jgi:hypothetical protein
VKAFTVHRSAFSVRRSAFSGAAAKCGGSFGFEEAKPDASPATLNGNAKRKTLNAKR